jgi:hypothetical protein
VRYKVTKTFIVDGPDGSVEALYNPMSNEVARIVAALLDARGMELCESWTRIDTVVPKAKKKRTKT